MNDVKGYAQGLEALAKAKAEGQGPLEIIQKALEASREREKRASGPSWADCHPEAGPGLMHAPQVVVATFRESDKGLFDRDFAGRARTYEPRFREALAVAVEQLSLIAGRGAGPLAHRLECDDALTRIAAILAGEKP